MNSGELFALGFYGPIALAAALALVLVQGVFLAIEQRYPQRTLTVMPVAICMGIGLSTLLSRRNLTFASVDIRLIASEDAGGASTFLRALTAVILAVCLSKIVALLMKRRLRSAPRLGGQTLLLTLLAFVIATHGLSAAFGTHPAFVHNSYYPIAAFVAFFMARGEDLSPFLDMVKACLLVLMMGSLLAAVFMPALALQPDYAGLIPGLRVRLWGLGPHANAIGPLALLLALLLYLRPFKSVWLQYMAFSTLLTVLVLAQSKTVWAASFVCLAFLALYGHGRDTQGRLKPGYLVAFVFAVLCLALVVLAADTERLVAKLTTSKLGGDLLTLTGRTTIWSEAWTTWLGNFWFGYGPDAWGPLHRAQIGLPFASHAHNQLLQNLSSAGLFGAVSMLAYLGCMLLASWRAARLTRGVSLALGLVILARAIGEAPLELDGLFSGETLLHLTWFVLVLLPFARVTQSIKVTSSRSSSLHPSAPIRA